MEEQFYKHARPENDSVLNKKFLKIQLRYYVNFTLGILFLIFLNFLCGGFLYRLSIQLMHDI